MKLNTYIIYCGTEFGMGCYNAKGYTPLDCYNRLSKRNQKNVWSIADENGNEYMIDDILDLASELQF